MTKIEHLNILKPRTAVRVDLDMVKSKTMDKHYKKIKEIASGESHVFIIGEYGSGKSRTARSIHFISPRAGQRFEKTLCISGDSSEIREELFGRLIYGHRTLMIEPGSLETARGGTLFLEGFSSLPYEIVNQLTEAHRNGYFKNVDSRRKISFNIRLIASINEKEYSLLDKSPFWNEIIEELNPVILRQPPLRERREDIPLLMHKFLQALKSRYPFLKVKGISPAALYHCLAYDWPGNVRQLKNATIHAAFLCDDEWIETGCLPSYLNTSQVHKYLKQTLEKSKSFALAEKELIHRVLKQSHSVIQASEALGYSLENLKHKLKQYRLKSPSYK